MSITWYFKIIFSERTIIVANDNKTAILLILRLKQDGVKTSVFTNYLADDEIVLGEQKKAFVEGAHKVAVCTTQMFEKMEFDVVKHVSFLLNQRLKLFRDSCE